MPLTSGKLLNLFKRRDEKIGQNRRILNVIVASLIILALLTTLITFIFRWTRGDQEKIQTIPPGVTTSETKDEAIKQKEIITGVASWYDYEYPKGSGIWITTQNLVAASRDYPRGTKVRVCNIQAEQAIEGDYTAQGLEPACVDVTITDFGPQKETGRVIDMGSLAFSKICAKHWGLCEVSIEKLN